MTLPELPVRNAPVNSATPVPLTSMFTIFVPSLR